MHNDTLTEFNKFLDSKSFVKEKYIPFYIHWARKFLGFSHENKQLNHDLKIKAFLNHLSNKPNITDWQIRQADDALRLFFHYFLKDDISKYHNTEHIKGISTDISKIVSEVQEALRIKRYAYRTEQTYIKWIKSFYYYVTNEKNKEKDEELESNDVRDFLSYLALKRNVSASTQNQAFNALLFLFRNVFRKDLGGLEKTVRAKRGQRLPAVLSVDEIQELFNHVKGTNCLILQLIYGAGLRLMELVRLRVKDIDFSSNLLFVRDGKGGKDRSTILPESVKLRLQIHLDKVNSLHEKDLSEGYGEVFLPNALERKYPNAAKEFAWQYVFPSSKLSADPVSRKIRRHHISGRSVQDALKRAVRMAGLAKHVSVHTLRHSFATHLMMNDVNIREIQQLLGHKNIETTMIYTHVMRDITKAPKSPLDVIQSKNIENT
jgi:integron integrase